jgi:hypothetical protein
MCEDGGHGLHFCSVLCISGNSGFPEPELSGTRIVTIANFTSKFQVSILETQNSFFLKDPAIAGLRFSLVGRIFTS